MDSKRTVIAQCNAVENGCDLVFLSGLISKTANQNLQYCTIFIVPNEKWQKLNLFHFVWIKLILHESRFCVWIKFRPIYMNIAFIEKILHTQQLAPATTYIGICMYFFSAYTVCDVIIRHGNLKVFFSNENSLIGPLFGIVFLVNHRPLGLERAPHWQVETRAINDCIALITFFYDTMVIKRLPKIFFSARRSCRHFVCHHRNIEKVVKMLRSTMVSLCLGAGNGFCLFVFLLARIFSQEK